VSTDSLLLVASMLSRVLISAGLIIVLLLLRRRRKERKLREGIGCMHGFFFENWWNVRRKTRKKDGE
jgi:hypothetical protein